MIIQGMPGSFRCVVVEFKNNCMYVKGEENGFWGYKVDSSTGSNGIFIEWIIEDQCLTISNDKFGFYPVFYIKKEGFLAFSSSISDLIEFDTTHDLDQSAIAVFLRMGTYVGDTTPFKNIKALPPGAQLKFDKNSFSLKTSRISCGQTRHDSIVNLQAEYGELFQHSIEKFHNVASSKICLPLSGGRDSRHILFALVRSGIKPFSCITMKHQPPKPDEDAEIARKVCDYLNVPHIILGQPLSLLNAEIEKNFLTNFCSLEHSWILPLATYLQKECYCSVYDGIGGDVLSAGLFLTKKRINLYRSGKLEELAEEILDDEGLLSKLLTKSAYQQFNRDVAINLVVNELKLHENTPNPVGQFYFWNRTRRHISMSSWRILSASSHVYAPYLENQLYKFLSSIPAEQLLDKTFHQNAISNYYPEFSHLPYETKTCTSKKNNHFLNSYQLFEIARYLLDSFSKDTMNNFYYLYPRIIKAFLSPDFYNDSKGIYRASIYLSQIRKTVQKHR